MKKKIFGIFSILAVVGLLSGCKPPVSSSNAESQEILTSETSIFSSEEQSSAGESTVVSSEDMSVLRIVSQPQSVTVKLGQEAVFEVIVNNEDLVKSYQWEMLNVDNETQTWVDLDCATARTNRLVIPGPDYELERPYRVKITDKQDHVLVSESAHYTFSDYVESYAYVSVGTRIVPAGQSLDLSKTPYGSGIVSLNDKGSELTLSNVNFNNSNFDYDPFDSEVAIYYVCYDYKAGEDFKLNLIGTNIITNAYFDSDNAGGIDLGFFFRSNTPENTKPTCTIQGEGSISLIGGSHCLYANTDLIIKSNITLTSLGNRWSSGIHGKSITVEEDVRIYGHLNQYLFEANGGNTPAAGILKIKKNAVIDVNVSPTHANDAGSALDAGFVMESTGDTIIDGATVNIGIDYDYLKLDGKPMMPSYTAIYTAKEGGVQIINSSKVNIHATTTNSSYNALVGGIAGISSSKDLIIDMSNVEINASCRHASQFNGIIGKAKITIRPYSNVFMNIVALKYTCMGSNESMSIDTSGINIVATAYSTTGKNYGVVAYDELTIVNDYSSITVTITDGIAMGVVYAKGSEKLQPQTDYVAQYLHLSKPFTYPEGLSINIYSQQGTTSAYQYFETIYNDYGSPAECILC